LREDLKLKKQDLYLEDRRFAENLKTNIIAKYELLHGKKPEDTEFDVNFIDIDRYKKGKLINYKNGIRIKGYLAPFEVCGNPELIAAAYECGTGDRNSLGMGMIEVVEGR
jgi:CRISPR-associated endoribonuclease Cas6